MVGLRPQVINTRAEPELNPAEPQLNRVLSLWMYHTVISLNTVNRWGWQSGCINMRSMVTSR